MKTIAEAKPGEMVTMKQEDYKAPHPTGEYLGFGVRRHNLPISIGVVVDDRIPEGVVELRSRKE